MSPIWCSWFLRGVSCAFSELLRLNVYVSLVTSQSIIEGTTWYMSKSADRFPWNAGVFLLGNIKCVYVMNHFSLCIAFVMKQEYYRRARSISLEEKNLNYLPHLNGIPINHQYFPNVYANTLQWGRNFQKPTVLSQLYESLIIIYLYRYIMKKQIYSNITNLQNNSCRIELPKIEVESGYPTVQNKV